MQSQAVRQCVICGVEVAVQAPPARTCDKAECRMAFRRHLEAGRPVCEGCGRPLTAHESARGRRICARSECHLQVAQVRGRDADQPAARCAVCRVPLSPQRRKAGVCEDRECVAVQTTRQLAEQEQQRREKLERLRKTAIAARSAAAAEAGFADARSHLAIVVPHTFAEVAPLPEERRQKFREHVETLVETALTQPPGDRDAPYLRSEMAAEASEAEAPLFGTGCRLCRGHCCQQGREHAFVNIQSIRNAMERRPEASAAELTEEYMSRLPEESIAGSCVFHGAAGCVLPREMRADMCNTWLCRGLYGIRAALERGEPPRFFVASADESSEQIVAAEFVSSE